MPKSADSVASPTLFRFSAKVPFLRFIKKKRSLNLFKGRIEEVTLLITISANGSVTAPGCLEKNEKKYTRCTNFKLKSRNLCFLMPLSPQLSGAVAPLLLHRKHHFTNLCVSPFLVIFAGAAGQGVLEHSQLQFMIVGGLLRPLENHNYLFCKLSTSYAMCREAERCISQCTVPSANMVLKVVFSHI